MTVVGAGISGLVAAIEAAERGWSVDLLEASTSLGGRARTMPGKYRANVGPHAVYLDGCLWQWLEQHGLQPSVVAAKPNATLFKFCGRVGGLPPEVRSAITRAQGDAPIDVTFRDWLLQNMDEACADAISGLLFVTTYDYDPGRLSAAFMAERLRRTLANTARYVVGGWARIVGDMTRRAQQLGVSLRTRTRVSTIGPEATVVATALGIARKVIGDHSLCWPSATTALLDVGLRSDKGIDWFRVLDLDARIYLARYTAVDESLAPPGCELIQIASAYRPGDNTESALGRAEGLLDVCWPGWRGRVQWQRRAIMRGLTGAIDLPGTSWRDRPAVFRRRMLCVATDQSAAAGMLAEVGTAAAIDAVHMLDADAS
jgi:hypothetical protein